ncbi:YceD family protein [Terriglobus tenax]|uniref:YceD family protein n=1 Tax=Terriglobus tenax TaxID=1111115 RepID=UPI0021E03767|nr:DUF177 domain-containing protein [Terriglobus tenax]
MLITPLQLEKEPLELDEKLPELDYAPDVRQVKPLTVTGLAELLEEHRGPKEIVQDIRLRAKYSGDFEVLCARCLDPVPQHLEGEFDLLFRPGGVDGVAGEHAISEAETEIGYYEQSGLVLEDVVREQVLLSLPGRTLCSEDCKGLCPSCGQNLNQGSCDCADRTVDPRWNALADLASRMKS